MASFTESIRGGVFLVINTIVIAIFTLIGGPLWGYLSKYISDFDFSKSPLDPSMVQSVPGTFFGLLLILEIVLVVNLFYRLFVKTSYATGEEVF